MLAQIFRELKNLLFIDIETVALQPDLDLLDSAMQALWKKRANRLAPDQPAADLYRQYAALSAEFGKIICIAAGYFYLSEEQQLCLRIKSFSGKNEKQLLTDFKELLENRFNKRTRLVAHNGKHFDYPYLCRRMLINRIAPPAILNIADQKPWEITHLDTMEMWQYGDRRYFTSLRLLATIFGINIGEDTMEGSMVHDVFYRDEDYERIAAYCRQDVRVTAQVYLAMRGYPDVASENIVELS
ncbi:MAG: 3'-5' exonuclease [Cytophagales bacterium]|nr:3'-5' exonuclease [Bernardetiaceae bacterium]MDW8205413.1 3'-5' exonuclease [Cytophagales bacterium]